MNKKGSVAIILIIIAVVLVVAIAAYFFVIKKPVTSGQLPTTSGTGTAEWKTYSAEGTHPVSMKHPADWTVRPILYQTPADAAAGKPASPVGYQLIAPEKTPGTPLGMIVVGGKQFTCEVQGQYETRCVRTKEVGDVHTGNNNPEILRVFDQFIKQFTVEKSFK